MPTPPVIVPGARVTSMRRDSEGYKTFTLVSLVRTEDGSYGPEAVSNTAGLFAVGAQWLLSANEANAWAYCQPDMEVTQHSSTKEGSPVVIWRVEQRFSTKPYDKRCKDQSITDPLLTPQELSGSFVKYQEEATHNRDGTRVMTSSHEQIRGPQVEFDANRPQVKIKQNVTSLQLGLFAQMVDTVNAYTLWGLPPRTIKLSNVQWSRKFYGSCSVYYERTLEFDIRYRRRNRVTGTVSSGTGTFRGDPIFTGDYETFDRDILDEGTKVLKGEWTPAGAWQLTRFGTLTAPTGLAATKSDTPDGSLAILTTYNYAVTALNGHGETTGSAPINVTPIGTENTIFLTWDAVPGATGYKVYGRRAAFTEFGLIGTVPGGITSWTDFGDNPVTPGVRMPSANTTSSLPDKNNPAHFIRFQDTNYNVCRVILDGNGLPAETRIATGTAASTSGDFVIGNVHVERYGESDFLILGIPASLE